MGGYHTPVQLAQNRSELDPGYHQQLQVVVAEAFSLAEPVEVDHAQTAAAVAQGRDNGRRCQGVVHLAAPVGRIAAGHILEVGRLGEALADVLEPFRLLSGQRPRRHQAQVPAVLAAEGDKTPVGP